MRIAVAIVALLALTGGAHAEKILLPAQELVDLPGCKPAMQRTHGLLELGHNVDAHLLAQTMTFLCPARSSSWEIFDAIALAKLEEHQRAYALLESIALQAGTQADRARILASWVLVKGNLGNPRPLPGLSAQDAARVQVFARIHQGREPGSQTAALSHTLQEAVTSGYARLQAIDTKSAWFAGTLSALVPGLGQAYAGSWQGAGVSLLLNGLFLSATIELAQHELYLASATTGMAGSIFYVGSILNAVDLVQRYNQGVTEQQRDKLESLLIPEAY